MIIWLELPLRTYTVYRICYIQSKTIFTFHFVDNKWLSGFLMQHKYAFTQTMAHDSSWQIVSPANIPTRSGVHMSSYDSQTNEKNNTNNIVCQLNQRNIHVMRFRRRINWNWIWWNVMDFSFSIYIYQFCVHVGGFQCNVEWSIIIFIVSSDGHNWWQLQKFRSISEQNSFSKNQQETSTGTQSLHQFYARFYVRLFAFFFLHFRRHS